MNRGRGRSRASIFFVGGRGGSVSPVLTAPTSFVVTAGDAENVLSWIDSPFVDLDTVDIYRSTTSGSGFSLIDTVAAGVQGYIDDGLTNGTTYYYYLISVDTDNNESSPSVERFGTPADVTAPSAPSAFTATAGDGEVLLEWTDPVDVDLDGINIYRSTTSGFGFTLLDTVTAGVEEYEDDDVTNDVTYYYRLTAFDTSSNESSPTSQQSATPEGEAPIPDVIWQAFHSSGNISEWTLNGGGGSFPNGTGGHTMALTTTDNDVLAIHAGPIISSPSGDGSRMFRWNEPQAQGASGSGLYYSVWLFVEEHAELDGTYEFLNIFQFKSNAPSISQNDPSFSFNLSDLGSGYRLYVRHHGSYFGGSDNNLTPVTSVPDFPIGQWVHIEAFCVGRRNSTGSLSVWQDGVLLFERDGDIQTMHNTVDSDHQWSVNVYSDGFADLENPFVIYIDEARIAEGRMYPHISPPSGVPIRPESLGGEPAPSPGDIPEFVGQASHRAFTATNTVSVPTGTEEGDIMVAVLGGSSNRTISDPEDGWTLVGSDTGGGGPEARIYFYVKIAEEDEPSSVWGWSASHWSSAVVLTYRGGILPTVSSMDYSGFGSSHTLPGISLADDSMVLWAAYWHNAGETSRTLSGTHTTRYEHTSTGGGLFVAEEERGAGATGTRSFTFSPGEGFSCGGGIAIPREPVE